MHLPDYILRFNLRPISRYAGQSTRRTIERYFDVAHQQDCAANSRDFSKTPSSRKVRSYVRNDRLGVKQLELSRMALATIREDNPKRRRYNADRM